MAETPKNRIVALLRQLWLKSAERGEALKLAGYTCNDCGVKKSVARGREQKVEVHHKHGILNWDEIISVIRKDLLCNVEDLEVLCPDCHKLK